MIQSRVPDRGVDDLLASTAARPSMRSVDVEPVRLAEVVDGADDLAGGALGAEVVVEGEVERDRVRAVLGEGELFVLLGADLDVVGLELHVLAVDVEVERAVLVERALHRRRRRCRRAAP